MKHIKDQLAKNGKRVALQHQIQSNSAEEVMSLLNHEDIIAWEAPGIEEKLSALVSSWFPIEENTKK